MAEDLSCGVSGTQGPLDQIQYLRTGCSLVSNHIGVVSVTRRGCPRCRSIDVFERPFGHSSQGSLRLQ